MSEETIIQANAKAFADTLKANGRPNAALRFSARVNSSGWRWVIGETTNRPTRENPVFSQIFHSSTAQPEAFEQAVRALLT